MTVLSHNCLENKIIFVRIIQNLMLNFELKIIKQINIYLLKTI
jgi:hypothetical protein